MEMNFGLFQFFAAKPFGTVEVSIIGLRWSLRKTYSSPGTFHLEKSKSTLISAKRGSLVCRDPTIPSEPKPMNNSFLSGSIKAQRERCSVPLLVELYKIEKSDVHFAHSTCQFPFVSCSTFTESGGSTPVTCALPFVSIGISAGLFSPDCGVARYGWLTPSLSDSKKSCSSFFGFGSTMYESCASHFGSVSSVTRTICLFFAPSLRT